MIYTQVKLNLIARQTLYFYNAELYRQKNPATVSRRGFLQKRDLFLTESRQQHPGQQDVSIKNIYNQIHTFGFYNT